MDDKSSCRRQGMKELPKSKEELLSELDKLYRKLADIKEKQKLADKNQGEILNALKIESLSTLTEGIADNFNSILTSILGNVNLARAYLKTENKLVEKLAKIEQAALRAKNITQELISFSHGNLPVKKAVSLEQVIRETAISTLNRSGVRCRFFFPPNLRPVEADENQIALAFGNIMENSVQAMPNGGTVNIRAENIVIEDDRDFPHLRKGGYVKVTVKDKGEGISVHHLPRIFDPFFTTRAKGSGLGLASSYSIVKRHNGHITVESRKGKGTSFSVFLPALERRAVPRPGSRKDSGEKRKVLIMDDEEIIRKVAGQMLESIGYEVEFARDGEEALEVYKKAAEERSPFDAVIMDLTIPGGMGGKLAIRKLRALDPQIKAIVSSAVSADPVMTDFKKYGFHGVVAKPYDVIQLSRALDEVL